MAKKVIAKCSCCDEKIYAPGEVFIPAGLEFQWYGGYLAGVDYDRRLQIDENDTVIIERA